MKNVIYISYDGLCDPVGSSQILPYIIELSKNDIKFFIISFEKKDKFEKDKSLVRSQIDGLYIEWLPCEYTKRPPIFSTLIDLRKMLHIAKRICKKNKIDFIHVRSYIPAICARKIFQTKKIPFIFDMRGFWADERIDGGIWSLKNPIYKTIYTFFKKQEKILLKDAEIVVSLTHSAKNYMSNEWKIDAKKIHVIPCAADYSLFIEASENDKKSFVLKHNIPNTKGKRLIYIGSTGTWYLLKEMFDFYTIFRDYFPNSQFVLCVNAMHPTIYAMQKQFQGEIFTIIEAPRADIPIALSLSNYSIMFIKPAFSKIASSPIKLGESLAVGVPIVCNSNVGDMANIENDNFGVIINNFENKDYLVACKKLMEIDFDNYKLRHNSEKVYELKENIGRYFAIYERIN